MVAATRTSSAWERYAWAAGILYVIALVAVTVVGVLGGGLSQNASAAKIANTLYDHRGRLLVVTYLSVVYAAMFLIYLAKLHDLLRRDTDRSRFLGSLVLTGGALFIALHAVSDIGIFGLLGAKLASFGFHHDQGVSYALYLVTYGLDSVGDVFGSLFAFAAGVLVIGSGVLPRWLGWVSILAGILFFLQGFGLGGVIASFGLVLDLIAFVLFLIFVLVSSVILLTRQNAVPDTAVESSRQLHRSYKKTGKGQKPAGQAVGLLTDSPTRPCRTPLPITSTPAAKSLGIGEDPWTCHARRPADVSAGMPLFTVRGTLVSSWCGWLAGQVAACQIFAASRIIAAAKGSM